MPKRQRPLAPTAPSRRARIATVCRVLSPRSSYDRSLSAAYRNGVSRLIATVVI